MQETRTFTSTILDRTPRESLFAFVPPAGVRRVRSFSDSIDSWEGTQAGDPKLPLKFKSSTGKIVTIESFRGRPVLLDFWATWCGPCVTSLPDLAKLYLDVKDKGMALISVDMDENNSTGAAFFAKKGFAWPNYHDAGQTVGALLGGSGIPRLLLIDQAGQVIYDTNIDALRIRIAKLGPEFQDLAPK
jgi:thiol-disulfide isomerase/thioredoxin